MPDNIDLSRVQWDDEAAPDPAAVKWDDQKEAKTNTVGEELARQAGLTDRAVLSGIGSVGAIPADVIGKAVNAFTGRETIPNQRQALQRTLSRMGLPEPQRPVERFTQGMAESAPAFALPAGLPAQVAGNAAIGATVAEPGQEAQGAAWGAIPAFVMGKALRGFVKPAPEAQHLLDQGVALTPGQASGARSVTKWIEEQASTLPVANHFIRSAQRRALEDSNVAAAQGVARMVDSSVKLGKSVREAIDTTRDVVGKTFDSALEGMTVPGFVPEARLGAVVQKAAADHPMMEQHQVAQMGRYVSQRVGQMVKNNNGVLDGAMLKQLDSELGGQIRNLRSSTNAADRTAAPAWADLQQSLRDVMEGAQGDPAKVAELSRANAAYRQLLALERSLLPGAEHFTPRRLAAAVDKAKLQNTGLGRTSDAMTKVLPNQIPSSGTAERLLTAGLPGLLLGGGAGAQQLGYGDLGAGLMTAGALGSRTGARLMTGTAAGQKMLQPFNPAIAAATAAALRGKGGSNDQ